jgi:Papain fold toxin 2
MKAQAEIWESISQIVVNYPVLECERCAIALRSWLMDNNIEHKILRLRTKRLTESFMIGDRYGRQESITENGIHYGIEVFDKVFDNLSAEGLSRSDWLSDFYCVSGQLLIEELTSL